MNFVKVFKFTVVTNVIAASLICFGLKAHAGHGEAPGDLANPASDLSDIYFFRSPEATDSVTVALTLWPFQSPSTGPEHPYFSPTIRYAIRVDSNGDAREDIIFEFRFRTERTIGAQSFQYAQNITNVAMPNDEWFVRQYMTVTHIDTETNTRTTLVTDQPVAPHFSGDSTANYGSLANQAIGQFTVPAGGQGRVFAGPRDDPFFADWGAISDRLSRRPTNSGNRGGGVDHFSRQNVLAIVLQVPISSVTLNRNIPSTPQRPDSIVGVWATTEQRQITIADTAGPRFFGPWRQVSRIGLPLINTFFMPSAAKDAYNRSAPINDESNTVLRDQLANPVLEGEFQVLNINDFIPVDNPRTDLRGVLAGQPHLNVAATDTNYTLRAADILRLDVTQPASDIAANATSSRMGLLAGNPGYPNGRRLFDDVVDITFQLVSGALLGAPWDQGLNSELGDGTDQNDIAFQNVFPYLANPHEGRAINGNVRPPRRN
ncbi:MAG: DUF4331 domain-containing protein [Myxococcota bacterium]|nr:DUF4331 domain-containing protein [Myxococcota bacterium]